MNLYELLESLGFDVDTLDHWDGMDRAHEILEMEIEVHQQPRYPLKSRVHVSKVVDGTISIAVGDATEYGSASAWESDDQ